MNGTMRKIFMVKLSVIDIPKGYYTCEQAVATMLRITESTIGELSVYSGGIIETTNTSGASGTDADQTNFVPKDWSWVAEGEGYGRQHFPSGKYVREDGRCVLYIESSDSIRPTAGWNTGKVSE